jgi:hypothetical protein
MTCFSASRHRNELSVLKQKSTLNFVRSYEAMQVALSQCSPRLIGEEL